MHNIGIMGGTFDPVHNGHVAIAQSVADQLKLERVLFIPTGNPNFKQDQQVTPAEMRVEMVRRAIAADSRFELDTCEVDREGVTYTADTLAELNQRFPQTRLFFIMGTDSALTLPKWRRAEEVAKGCTIVVAQRPGQSTQELHDVLDACPIPFDLVFLDVPQVDVSSTQIREQMQAGATIEDMVPLAVVEYIENEGLYV